MKTSELLRKAADEIRRRGWIQGDYGSSSAEYKTCPVCSMGALQAASTGDPWAGDLDAQDAGRALYRTLGRERSVVRWNDAAGRTVEEVLEKFEEAARAAEREESLASTRESAEREGD